MRHFGTLATIVVLLAAACGATDKKATNAPVANDGASGDRNPKQEPVKAEISPVDPNADVPRDPIYFDFDSFTLSDAAKERLQKVADYLSKHPGSTVTISGHTDERGTTEYNLALADQRAKVAHDFLLRLGVDANRIKTISYGEERPAAKGEGEETWGKNRRDEFETNKPNKK
jgi:peptidoglycan-associated lipoprotein